MANGRWAKNMFAQLKSWVDFNAYRYSGDTAPLSGTSGFGVGTCGPGSTFVNSTTGVEYINEGTAASPYWTPINPFHRNLISVWSDFRDGAGSAVAGTAASTTIPGSGIRIFGTAEPNATGGMTVAHGANGAIATMFCGTTTGLQIAMGMGGATVPFDPATMGPLVLDTTVTQLTALTLRRFWCGFIGTAADALVSPATGATVTITNVQADLAGFMFDVGLTAATSLFVTRNKGNDNPTLAVTATGVPTGKVVVVGTYQRFRVEIWPNGTAYFFIDKELIQTIENAVTPTTDLSVALALHSTSAAAKDMAVKQFGVWANRVL